MCQRNQVFNTKLAHWAAAGQIQQHITSAHKSGPQDLHECSISMPAANAPVNKQHPLVSQKMEKARQRRCIVVQNNKEHQIRRNQSGITNRRKL